MLEYVTQTTYPSVVFIQVTCLYQVRTERVTSITCITVLLFRSYTLKVNSCVLQVAIIPILLNEGEQYVICYR